MTDNTELKRLAEAAPEGPWFGPEYAPGTSYVFDVDLGTLLHYESIDTEQDACLRYVAAANPAVVLALITENENLVAWREGLIKERAAHIRQRDQLKAEIEALRLEREGKVLCELELFETLRDSANTEADEHRQCMATYRPLRQENLDSVVKKCDDLLAAMGKGEQS